MSVHDLIMSAAGASGGTGPAGIASGLVFWLDPSDNSTVTNVSGVCSQLLDKSPSARVLSQATPSLRPEVQSTTFGIQAIGFTSGALLDFNSALNFGSTFTAVMVASLSQGSGTYRMIGFSNSTNTIASGTDAFFWNTANAAATLQAQVSTRTGNGNSYTYLYSSDYAAGKHLVLLQSTATPGQGKIRLDRAVATIGGDTLDGPPLINRMGSASAELYSSSGVIGEVAVYNRILSAGEITTLENYLRTKWGTP